MEDERARKREMELRVEGKRGKEDGRREKGEKRKFQDTHPVERGRLSSAEIWLGSLSRAFITAGHGSERGTSFSSELTLMMLVANEPSKSPFSSCPDNK